MTVDEFIKSPEYPLVIESLEGSKYKLTNAETGYTGTISSEEFQEKIDRLQKLVDSL